MLTTVSRKILKGGGQKQHNISGEVDIFFLQTRKLLLSPCKGPKNMQLFYCVVTLNIAISTGFNYNENNFVSETY